MAKAFEIIADPVLRTEEIGADFRPSPKTYIVIADSMQEAITKTEEQIKRKQQAERREYVVEKVKLLAYGDDVIT